MYYLYACKHKGCLHIGGKQMSYSKLASAGEAVLNNPNNTQVICKVCNLMFVGAAEIIDHLDAHN